MRHIRKEIRFGLGGRQGVLCFKLEFFININLVDNSKDKEEKHSK